MSSSAPQADASLVVSLYKSERYLDRFVKTVRRFAAGIETAGEVTVELVVVFNAPSAHERRVGSRLLALQSGRVRIQSVEVERETLYASWNRGIGLATGDVLGFWNADDRRFPAAIVEAVAGIRAGARLMYFPHVVDQRWREWNCIPQRRRLLIPAPEFDAQAARRAFLPGPFFMFSRELYDEVGSFDEQFRICGDRDWGLRALARTAFTPGSQIAGVFLNEHQGLSMSGSARAVAENNAIYTRHGLEDLAQAVDPSLAAEYDAHRMLVAGTWSPVGEDRATASVGRDDQESSTGHEPLYDPVALARSLESLAHAGHLDRRLRRLAASSARRFRAAVARMDLEARLRRGDLRGARLEFLRVRRAYLSTARFLVATPVALASPRSYASYLRRRRPQTGALPPGGYQL